MDEQQLYKSIPEEYRNREQTYLKHRVLSMYLQSWAQKMASLARGSKNREAKLWFVDCFSGPWQSAHQELEDTSIFIGLKAISDAETFWNAKGFNIKIGAIFVEKDASAFTKLQNYLNSRQDLAGKEIHAIHGQFGDNVTNIERLIKNDPAFIFIDPTGWKGAAMGFIAPLAKRPLRDVMVNVMSWLT